MGQYYKVHFVRESTGEVSVFTPGVIDREDNVEGEGIKLLEHSYWNNPFCCAITSLLTGDNKAYITWCGDYAEESETRRLGFHHKTVWGVSPHQYPRIAPPYFHMDEQVALLNHSKHQYLDLKKYKEKFDKMQSETSYRLWCIHPLPLLTALGNGRGGGDYSSSMLNYNKVGIWAGDLLSVGDPLTGYTEVDAFFVERSTGTINVRSKEYTDAMYSLYKQVDSLAKEANNSNDTSDWDAGVLDYAHDLTLTLLEYGAERRAAPDVLTNPEAFEQLLLNGAKDWDDYSRGGFTFSWTEDIVGRLGLDTNDWCLNQQTKALQEAAALLKGLVFKKEE